MDIEKKTIDNFRKQIWEWYAIHKRDLPWRYTRDPYGILVSEMMAQQTQIARVVPKFRLWMECFPSFASLAEASSHQVLSSWSGLGYNKRALSLHEIARIVTTSYNGQLPSDEKRLRDLPGIGEYTCSALQCFAFDKQIPVIDVNVRKVITIHFWKGNTPSKERTYEIASLLLPKGKAYEWNQALMDYAAVCLKGYRIERTKQSPFKGSDRYYRGKIIKLLTEKKTLSHDEVKSLFPESMVKERQEKIVCSLQEDKLIIISNEFISFPS